MAREKYIGESCVSCHEQFDKNDDVVVCPECGSPYHRDCYNKEGRCINTELHETGSEWKPEGKELAVPKAMPENVTAFSAGDTAPSEKAHKTTSYDEADAKVICPLCKHENRASEIFCEKCSFPLEANKQKNENKKNVCSVCGLENRENDVFCVRCGSPLDMEKATSSRRILFGMPFGDANAFSSQSDLEGNTVDEYAKYVGRNFMSFLPKFMNFSKGGSKFSLNIGALFFPTLYFFYRKMNSIGIIVLLISVVLGIPSVAITLAENGMLDQSFVNNSTFETLSLLSTLLSTVMNVASCVLADWLYYRQAKRDIEKIKKTYLEENAKNSAIVQKGGVSWTGVLIAITTIILIAFVMTFVATVLAM